MQMLLNNRYQVIRSLGSGGFGETFLAEDTQMPSSRRCVIKQLRPIQNNPQIYQLVQERFQREAAILEELGGCSDQIPSLYAYFQSEGQFYLVQEWVSGDTLTAKLQKQGLFSEPAVREILLDLLPVLEYVHSKRIIHRDIKPDNIIIRERDSKSVLIDFGAVRESMGTVVNSQGHPTSSIVIGTPGYMPSEQATGRPVYSSDLYSLGLTAIYLLTGKQPQQLESDSQTGEIVWRHYASHISNTLAGVLDRAIPTVSYANAYHPRDRFSTATAMLQSLHSVANPIPPTQQFFSPPPTVRVNQQPVTQSNNQRSILMSGLIAGGLIGASVIISQVLKPSPQSVVNQEVTPTVTETPVLSSPPVIQKNVTSPVIQQTVLPSPTTNSYLWLSERLVTDADLDDKDGLELDIMRNSIYARHGRRFDTPSLQEYFNNQSWYNPVYSPKAFPPKLLSNLEQRNAEYVSKYQDRNQRRHFPK
ncbi:protein kinase domain-containing protein [Nodularia sphaerocarpa]|uniref:protein kinase domain-containing protein n=1 Tax=Nodularia sphaerocarpa TaxID=137816 RepID=UPI001EFB3063|nr:YARHG domain-containing protein [Nodularia sphaerocarpa]MDB9374042.1 YARHG domain-containing protein [Nodularia sphaerocarpa CS-585]MDB9377077.1 YARHG domain-containing protein [Nodularia sphaerocarpa CS-585A2]ULP72414.1 Serine/threonine-protein kinase C [Nodularia sphaerocarpa UHCC 0038]